MQVMIPDQIAYVVVPLSKASLLVLMGWPERGRMSCMK